MMDDGVSNVCMYCFVGLKKGVINLYFEGSCILKHNLRPAYQTDSSEDSSASSVVGIPGGRTLFSFLPTAVAQRCVNTTPWSSK